MVDVSENKVFSRTSHLAKHNPADCLRSVQKRGKDCELPKPRAKLAKYNEVHLLLERNPNIIGLCIMFDSIFSFFYSKNVLFSFSLIFPY